MTATLTINVRNDVGIDELYVDLDFGEVSYPIIYEASVHQGRVQWLMALVRGLAQDKVFGKVSVECEDCSVIRQCELNHNVACPTKILWNPAIKVYYGSGTYIKSFIASPLIGESPIELKPKLIDALQPLHKLCVELGIEEA